MKILGIDTSTKFLCLGLFDGVRTYEYNLDAGVKNSVLLMPTIKRVLDYSGLSIDDIDYFACGTGPGSFTGIRVGMATVKGLAWILNKPVIGISTLDILAAHAVLAAKFVIPAIDAKRNLIYCSIYSTEISSIRRSTPYMLLTIPEFLKKIKKRNVALFGDGANLYKDKILEHVPGANILDRDYWYPKGRQIISLALQRIKAKKIDSAFDVKPIYLYPKDCQIRQNSKTKG